MFSDPRESTIAEMFRLLFEAWGAQHWWPAESPFEVIVGAFLTQNTAWTNVSLALENLRSSELLNEEGVRGIAISELETLIRPAGYFRQKARRLKNFVAYLDEKYAGSLDEMFRKSTAELREELLNLNGVGPETADSILLYAGNHPVFVVDAYTRRIFERHYILSSSAAYEEIRSLCERALESAKTHGATPLRPLTHKPAGSHHVPSLMSTAKRSAQAQIFNEMHGLIVGVGKNFCQKSRALCQECPLHGLPHVNAATIEELKQVKAL